MLMRCCFFLYFSFLFFNAVEHCVGMSKKIYGINIKCKKHTVVNFATTTNDLMKGEGAEKRKFEHVSNILYSGERDVKKQCAAIDCDTVIERDFDQQNILKFLQNKNIDGIIDIITKDVYPNQGMASVGNYRHSIEEYICTQIKENHDDFFTQVKCVTLFFSGGLFSSNPYFFENYNLFLDIEPNLRMRSVCNSILKFFQEEAGYYEQEINIVKDWMECYGINK